MRAFRSVAESLAAGVLHVVPASVASLVRPGPERDAGRAVARLVEEASRRLALRALRQALVWTVTAGVALGAAVVAAPAEAGTDGTPSAPGPVPGVAARVIDPASLPAKRDTAMPAYADSRKKKKKKKKKEEDDFGVEGLEGVTSDEGDNGVGVHREQAGVDHPYGTEFSGSTTLQLFSSTTGGGSASSSTDIDIGGAFLFIVGRIELGPELRYLSSSVSTPVGGTTVKTTTTAYQVGPQAKLNFASLDHALIVPFAEGGLDYQGSSVKSDGSSAVNSTGYVLHAGGGVNLFLTDHVSFQPVVEYHYDKLTPSGSGTDPTTTTGLRVVFGIGTFL